MGEAEDENNENVHYSQRGEEPLSDLSLIQIFYFLPKLMLLMYITYFLTETSCVLLNYRPLLSGDVEQKYCPRFTNIYASTTYPFCVFQSFIALILIPVLL